MRSLVTVTRTRTGTRCVMATHPSESPVTQSAPSPSVGGTCYGERHLPQSGHVREEAGAPPSCRPCRGQPPGVTGTTVACRRELESGPFPGPGFSRHTAPGMQTPARSCRDCGPTKPCVGTHTRVSCEAAKRVAGGEHSGPAPGARGAQGSAGPVKGQAVTVSGRSGRGAGLCGSP